MEPFRLEPFRLVLVENICHFCNENPMKFQKQVDWNCGWYCCDSKQCNDELSRSIDSYYKKENYIDFNKFIELFPEIDIKEYYSVLRSDGQIEDNWSIETMYFAKLIQLTDNNNKLTKNNEYSNIIIWVNQEDKYLKKAQNLKIFLENNKHIKITYEEFEKRIVEFLNNLKK
jgi:hypothetical protein